MEFTHRNASPLSGSWSLPTYLEQGNHLLLVLYILLWELLHSPHLPPQPAVFVSHSLAHPKLIYNPSGVYVSYSQESQPTFLFLDVNPPSFWTCSPSLSRPSCPLSCAGSCSLLINSLFLIDLLHPSLLPPSLVYMSIVHCSKQAILVS